LLVVGGTVAYRTVVGFAHVGITREPAAQLAAVENTVTAAPVELPAAAPVEVPPAVHADSIPLAEAVPAPALPALAAAAVPAAPAPAAAALEAPRNAAPSQAELQAALRATPIVMYSASWCGVCRQAKRFFSENGLRYREIDADTTPGAWAKVEQLIGRRAVPVIVVDGKLASAGLSPSSIMRAVAQSMEQRLGVRGIRFDSE
jgi:glutaredoxin